MNGDSRKKSVMDEVEELLNAAQDDMLLKLGVNSSNESSSNQVIGPDLDRRFQALRSRPKPKPNPNPNPNPNPKSSVDEIADADDDLFVRFATLKGSLPSYSTTTTTTSSSILNDQKGKNEDDDEDEVDKVIRWAIDAARLDPSPCSEEEDDDDSDNDEFSDDDSGGQSMDGKKKKKG